MADDEARIDVKSEEVKDVRQHLFGGFNDTGPTCMSMTLAHETVCYSFGWQL